MICTVFGKGNAVIKVIIITNTFSTPPAFPLLRLIDELDIGRREGSFTVKHAGATHGLAFLGTCSIIVVIAATAFSDFFAVSFSPFPVMTQDVLMIPLTILPGKFAPSFSVIFFPVSSNIPDFFGVLLFPSSFIFTYMLGVFGIILPFMCPDFVSVLCIVFSALCISFLAVFFSIFCVPCQLTHFTGRNKSINSVLVSMEKFRRCGIYLATSGTRFGGSHRSSSFATFAI